MVSFRKWWVKSHNSRWERFSFHAIFWMLYLCFLGFTAFEHHNIDYSLRNLSVFLFWFSPVYLIWVYYLFVHTSYVYIQTRQYLKAILAGLAVFLIYIHSDILFSYMLGQKLSAHSIPSKIPKMGDFATFYRVNLLSWFSILHALFGFTLYMLLPILCKFFRDLQRSQSQFNELKERNMQLELNLIKSQMNPHFLLNTLNNIYGLTIMGTKQQIGEMVLNLSNFLKYSLYEGNNEFISISKEIKLIQSYVELESVRSDFIETVFEIQVDRDNYMVPPFVLFPLVENAFKHGAKNLTGPTNIVMKLAIVENRLTFRVANDLQTGEPLEGGIGLPALKKKLAYYYPGNSECSSTIVGGRYIAQLQIKRL